MIEIGKSLPNLTDPTATSGAAEMFAFKAMSSSAADHAGRRRPDQPTLTVSNVRLAPQATSGGSMKGRLLHRRECGRRQQLIDDVGDNLAVGLGFRTSLAPFGEIYTFSLHHAVAC